MSERWRATLACRNPSIRRTPLPTVSGSTLQPFPQIRDGHRVTEADCGVSLLKLMHNLRGNTAATGYKLEVLFHLSENVRSSVREQQITLPTSL